MNCLKLMLAVGAVAVFAGGCHDTKRAESMTDELHHDFGMLRPNETATHEFEIHNPTAETWTLKEVEVGCACTVASIDFEKLEGGGRGVVALEYHSPGRNKDDERHITLQFVEDNVPPIVLSMSALIREEATIEPSVVSVEQVLGNSNPVTRKVLCFNYSEEDWVSLQVEPDEELFFQAVAASEPMESEGHLLARQVWEVALSFDAANMLNRESFDSAQLPIVVSYNDGRTIQKQISVRRRVDLPWMCLPGSIAFGEVPSGQQESKIAYVVLLNGGLASGEIAVGVSGSNELNADCDFINERKAKLVCKFSSDSLGEHTGKITIHAAGHSWPDLEIPFRVRVTP